MIIQLLKFLRDSNNFVYLQIADVKYVKTLIQTHPKAGYP